MDISTIRPKETLRFALKHPESGDPLDAEVVIHGPYTEPGRAASERVLAVKDDASPIAWLDRLVAESIIGFPGLNDGPADLSTVTPEQAHDIFKRHPWIALQAREQYGATASFFETPSTPSSRTRRTKRSSAK